MKEYGNFIDHQYIVNLLEQSRFTDNQKINEILDKAERFDGLTPEEVAILLTTENKNYQERIFKIADKIKQHIYGDRIVMFAPLYVSDYCVNHCSYCGFNCKNKFQRTRLTMDEIREEVKILEAMGHKRLALEAGEDPVNCDIDYIIDCMKTIYDMKLGNGEIRRVNVNIASTTVENYRKLKEVGIGTYILFQETYHKETYEKVHLGGPKKNYEYHLTAFDRAMEAGIDDVGGGVLFGLSNDWRYEILGLMLHNKHLEDTFGVGFHTISVPRMCPAEGNDLSGFYPVDDATFLRIVSIIRLAVPFTGIIISTRENSDMRKELIRLGVSQMSGGSSVDVGGYSKGNYSKGSQFVTSDDRSAQDIIRWIMEEGMVPSFCTACYRKGRTGDRFMELAKTGNIKNVCLPNGLMTLKEYALDYGDEAFRVLADKVIEKHIPDIENEKVRTLVLENLRKLEQGERDLFL
ncbi:MAG: [FeFe] hydrogenase H-cluster radical SAM maturase HydG [Clostridia bacterium]|nr:[FeFe] hydrogenase H-cluster radical SAM maturase HydG [Clostridia bacterium]